MRYVKGVKNVEFFRDVKPILDRSCVACHTHKAESSPGNLVLDDEKKIVVPFVGSFPGTYYRLAKDQEGKFGYKPLGASWRHTNASRYVRMFQSRRSLLIWKVYGRRLDGWTNDDFPTETVPGDPKTLQDHGKSIPATRDNINRADLDYTGSQMPPLEAVEGTYKGPDGRPIKVAPLTDEDRRTLVRWIDLGCPIDLDYNPAKPEARGYGWMCDDNRPTLTLTYPKAGDNEALTRLVVGMHDYGTGLDMKSFSVVADFPLDGAPAGTELGSRFKLKDAGVWEYTLKMQIAKLPQGKLTVVVKDVQGNVSKIERAFSVSPMSP